MHLMVLEICFAKFCSTLELIPDRPLCAWARMEPNNISTFYLWCRLTQCQKIKNTTSRKWNFTKMASHDLLNHLVLAVHTKYYNSLTPTSFCHSPFIIKYISLISMISCPVLKAMDRYLSDCAGLWNIPFGGKTFVLGDDFRQTLPIVSKAHNFGYCELLRQKLRPLK